MKALTKLIYGFLFGIGFALAVYLIDLAFKLHEDDVKDLMSEIEAEKYEGIELEVKNEVIRENDVVVFIHAVNNTNKPKGGTAFGPSIEIEFYDGNGRFLDECRGKQLPEIPPGEKEVVKIICNNSEFYPIDNYRNVKVGLRP